MKFLILFILGFIIFYWLRRLLVSKPQPPEKPTIRTVTEASAATLLDKDKEPPSNHKR